MDDKKFSLEPYDKHNQQNTEKSRFFLQYKFWRTTFLSNISGGCFWQWLLLTEQWQKAKLFLFVEPSTNGVWIQHSILCSTHSLHCSHSTENLVPSSFFIFGHQWRHCCIGIFYPGVCYLMFILLILRINSFVVNLENYFLRLTCRNV